MDAVALRHDGLEACIALERSLALQHIVWREGRLHALHLRAASGGDKQHTARLGCLVHCTACNLCFVLSCWQVSTARHPRLACCKLLPTCFQAVTDGGLASRSTTASTTAFCSTHRQAGWDDVTHARRPRCQVLLLVLHCVQGACFAVRALRCKAASSMTRNKFPLSGRTFANSSMMACAVRRGRGPSPRRNASTSYLTGS